MIFEMKCGFLPFGENCEDQEEIEFEIKNSTLEIPEFIEPQIKEVIEKLLSKNPIKRMEGGFEKLKSMEWFKDFDWVLFIL